MSVLLNCRASTGMSGGILLPEFDSPVSARVALEKVVSIKIDNNVTVKMPILFIFISFTSSFIVIYNTIVRDKGHCETSVSKNETVVPPCPFNWTLAIILDGDVNE